MRGFDMNYSEPPLAWVILKLSRNSGNDLKVKFLLFSQLLEGTGPLIADIYLSICTTSKCKFIYILVLIYLICTLFRTLDFVALRMRLYPY